MARARQSTRDFKGDHLSAKMFQARGDGAADDTDALFSTLIPLAGDGSGIRRIIPSGVYLVTPGVLLIPNPQSGLLVGHGALFNTSIQTRDRTSTAAILTLGDGTFEPSQWEMQFLTIDADDGANTGLYFNRVNLMTVRGVSIRNIGTGGFGMLSASSPLLFGEMIFDSVKVTGPDTGLRAGSTGVLFYPTGNVSFWGSNIEQVENGLILQGSAQQKFTFVGGHLERISKHAFILNGCQPLIDCDVYVGDIWLGNDVVNGDLNIANSSGLWSNGAIVDNGFGNRIRRSSGRQFSGGSTFSAGVAFDGTEWLSVAGIVDDPTFLSGVATWSGSSATVAAAASSMPGVKRGKSLAVYSAAGGGYGERTFTALANTDYLLAVGLLTKPADTYRITLSNSGGVVWDSGNFSYPDTGLYAGNFHTWRVIRKSIPVATDTVFKVRIYAVTALQTTICGLLLASQSVAGMVDYATTGAGFSSAGAGVTLTYTQDTTTGTLYTFRSQTVSSRCFARAVVTVPAGVSGLIGVGGAFTDATAGPMVTMRSGVTAEYIIPLASFPANSTLDLHSPAGGGSITISEIGIYPITELEDAPFVTLSPYTGVKNAWDLQTKQRLYVPSGIGTYAANWQAQPTAANGFIDVLSASNIYWDETSATFKISAFTGTTTFWHMVLMENTGDIAIACEYNAAPFSSRTLAQVLAQVRFRIFASDINAGTAADATFGFYNATRSETVNLTFSAGSPAGVVASAGPGCVNVDVTNGVLYIATGGGTGNWHAISPLPQSLGTGDSPTFANVNVTSVYKVGGTQVVSSRGSAVTTVSGTAGATYTSTERDMLNNLENAVNAIISRLQGHGLIS